MQRHTKQNQPQSYTYSALRHKTFSLPTKSLLDSPEDTHMKHKLKEFADLSFKFDKKGQKILETGIKRSGKRRNCSL